MRSLVSSCRIMLCCLTPLIVAPATRAQTASPQTASVVDGARQFLRGLEPTGFSGVVLIRKGSDTLLLDGYGFSDCARTRRMTPDIVFDVGSITKAFTAVAVLGLVADGHLALSDTLSTFFAKAPADKGPITVEQLLRHTSGFPESFGKDEDFVAKDPFLEHAFSSPLIAKPGAGVNYSNVAYTVLGALIERVTGKRYEQVLAERQFAPLGLKQTGYLFPAWPHGTLACGNWDGRNYGATRDYFGPDGPSWNLMANGGLHSTAGELADWFDGVRSGKLLPPELTGVFVEALTHTTKSGDLHYIGTSGSNIVFTAEYLHFIETDVTVVVLTSDSRWPKEKVTTNLLERIRPLWSRPAVGQ